MMIVGPDNIPMEGGMMDRAEHSIADYQFISVVRLDLPKWFGVAACDFPPGELNMAINDGMVLQAAEGPEPAVKVTMLRLARFIAANHHLFKPECERKALAILAANCPLKARAKP